jgi:assimilatory nitrate reductase catalytic subunit
VLVGGARGGVFMRAAAAEPVAADVVAAIDRLFGLDAACVVRYDDPRRAIARRVRIDGSRIIAVRLAGDIAAEAWLRDWLVTGQDVSAMRAHLLVPYAGAPAGYRTRGRIVCSCHGVTETQLRAAIAECAGPPNAVLAAIQSDLRCGTGCGSCLPEVRALIDTARAPAGVAA